MTYVTLLQVQNYEIVLKLEFIFYDQALIETCTKNLQTVRHLK